ncbi:MAG: hypothetical protein LUG85_07025, partial [Clostridiales bacterium]|nr:hypothetical protein [Clostridiales bacterium]
KSRLTAEHAACLIIFRNTSSQMLEIRQYSLRFVPCLAKNPLSIRRTRFNQCLLKNTEIRMIICISG